MDDNSNSVASLPPEDVVVKEEIEDVPPAVDVDLEEETDQENSNGFAQFPAPSENSALSLESLYACLSFTKQCYLCYSIFPSTSALNSHFTTDHYVEPDTSHHRCGFCGFSFRSDAILKEHRAILHPNEGEDRPWACEACGARFGEWRGLRAHRQRQCGLNPEMENMSFYWVGKQAQRRARNYSRVKWTWRCEQCPVLFAQVAELKRHRQRSHGITILLTEENVANKASVHWVPEDESSRSSSPSSASSSNYPQIGRARDVIAEKVSQNGAQMPAISNLTAPTSTSQSPVVRQQHAASSMAPTPNSSLNLPKPPLRWFSCPLCSAMFQYKTSLKTHQRYHHSNASNPAGLVMNPLPSTTIGSSCKAKTKHLSRPQGVASSSSQASKKLKKYIKIPKTTLPPKMAGPRPKNRYQRASEGETSSIESARPKLDRKESAKLPKKPPIWPRPGPWEAPVKPLISPNTPTNRKISCPLCPSSRIPSALWRHLSIHLLGRPWRCPLCPSSFAQLVRLKSHLTKLHPADNWDKVRLAAYQTPPGEGSDKAVLTCPLCPAASYNENPLRAHLEAHTVDDPWTCEVCGIPFLRLTTLQDHRKVVHNLTTDVLGQENVVQPVPASQAIFNCEKCPASYKGIALLKAHLKVHTHLYPVICESCGVHFGHERGLLAHQKTGSCGVTVDSANGSKRQASDDDGGEESDESETKKRRVDAEEEAIIEEASRIEGEHSCLNQELPKQLFDEAEDPIA